jgi:hypothetical protein
VREGETLAVYRGWMLRPEHYAKLHEALLTRGVRLLNDPAAYRHCHYLPESYAAIAGHTPRTGWLPAGPDGGYGSRDGPAAPVRRRARTRQGLRQVTQTRMGRGVLHSLGGGSRGSRARRAAFPRIAGRRSGRRAGLSRIRRPGASGRSSQERDAACSRYCTFFFDGAPLYAAEYWETGAYAGEPPPLDLFAAVARGVASRFFTMDVARRNGGDWLIVELSDAQVAGLPERADPAAFYRVLADRWPAR